MISTVEIFVFFYASGGQGALFEKTAPLDPPQKLFIRRLPGDRILFPYVCNL